MDDTKIILKPGREKPVRNRHPWVFSGAVAQVKPGALGSPSPGDWVTVCSSDGRPLARGYWNPRSQILVRLLSWDPDEFIDAAWWRARLRRAIVGRERLALDAATTAYRLVNAESDGMPGLVVDRYGDWLVAQALTLGIDRRKAVIVELLDELLAPTGIFERSDVDVRRKEGLAPESGMLRGDPPPEHMEIVENGYCFQVDVREGHKTGFYLDQRDNRALLADWLRTDPDAGDKSALNAFSYTGGFAVYALDAGVRRVVNVDSAADALALARANLALNGLAVQEDDFIEGDVFQVLRDFRAAGRRFDIVVLDPPKFAHSARDVKRAARGYKDINLLAFQLIRPGGLLMTFSCSGAVDADLFQKVVFGALIDAGREGQIVQRLGAGADHPVALTFPEGAYLKGLLCRVW